MTTPPKTAPRGTYASLKRTTAPTPTDTPPAPADTLAAIVAAVRATRPVRTRTTPRYGRKGMPGMTQLGVVIPVELKARVAAFAQATDLQLAEAAHALLEVGLATVERRPT